MNHEEAKIKTRLEEVLESIFCAVGGCWRKGRLGREGQSGFGVH
jgi:hypothetical protein